MGFRIYIYKSLSLSLSFNNKTNIIKNLEIIIKMEKLKLKSSLLLIKKTTTHKPTNWYNHSRERESITLNSRRQERKREREREREREYNWFRTFPTTFFVLFFLKKAHKNDNNKNWIRKKTTPQQEQRKIVVYYKIIYNEKRKEWEWEWEREREKFAKLHNCKFVRFLNLLRYLFI